MPALLARSSPLRTSHLRDPLGPQLNFASEWFIDELAAARADPMEFRLKHIEEERGIAVIEAAAEKADWTRGPRRARTAGSEVSGRGIAYARRNGTLCAAIVEVEVNRPTGSSGRAGSTWRTTTG